MTRNKQRALLDARLKTENLDELDPAKLSRAYGLPEPEVHFAINEARRRRK